MINESCSRALLPELMSPAGNFSSLSAALRAGADSVYLGIGQLQMRSRSACGFQPEDLVRAVRLCHAAGSRLYLTLNTLIYDGEEAEIRQMLTLAADAGVDAIIAWDPAVIEAARSLNLTVHLSVQAGVANVSALRFYARWVDAVVLARELSLTQIARICQRIETEKISGPSGSLVQVEVFVHGAMCIAVSGRCGLSLATDRGFRKSIADQNDSSGNRGNCLQPCRRRYRLLHDDTGQELTIEDGHVLSPADLCTLPILDQIVATGVKLVKIEGRGRSADYVTTVTTAYREGLQRIADNVFSADWARAKVTELETVFNRRFWQGGNYLGHETGAWSRSQGSQATLTREFLGRVTHWYGRPGVAELHLQAGSFCSGDILLFEGPLTGSFRCQASSIRQDDIEVKTPVKGQVVTISLPQKARRGDKVYRLVQSEPDEQSQGLSPTVNNL